MSARGRALDILISFDKGVAGLDTIIDREFSDGRIDRRDRRLIFEIVCGVVRRRLTLDHVIRHFMNDERSAENKRLMNVLRMGMYQIVYLDRMPDYAAVNESVKLARDDRSTRSASSMVNAVLRKIIGVRKRLPLPDYEADLTYRLSVTYSHPEWLVDRWLGRIGLRHTKALLEFNNTRPIITLRRRLRGLSRQQFEIELRPLSDLAAHGYRNLYYRLIRQMPPEEVALLHEGHCTVQAESSGWVIALMDLAAGDRVLDVCSAPGGKASLMAELVGKSGAVCAGDLRRRRLMEVVDSVRRMGLGNLFPVVCDGARPPFDGQFDKVLLDAPCSGTGVMHRHPDARWRRSQQDISRVVAIQEGLLDGAASLVTPGGVMVYATCSVEPEENREQVRAFLDRHAEYELEPGNASVPSCFLDEDGCLSITPWEHKLDGMFAARLRRSR